MRQTAIVLWGALTLGSLPALAQSSASGSTTAPLETAISKLQPVDEIFDGNALVEGVTLPAAKQRVRTYLVDLNEAITTWEALPAEQKAAAKGRMLGRTLDEKVSYGQRLRSAYMNAVRNASMAESAKAAEQAALCKRFSEQVMTVERREPMQRLIGMRADGHQGVLADIATVGLHRRVVTEVTDACALPQYQPIIEKGCSDTVGAENPQVWCQTMEVGTKLVAQGVLNHIMDEVAEYARLTGNDLAARDGFLPVDGAAQYSEILNFSVSDQNTLAMRYRPLFRAAGMSESDNTVWDQKIEERDALRLKVESLASTYAIPPAGDPMYGVRLAKQQVKRWHRRAKIIKAFVSPGDWKLKTADSGEVTGRTREGYVLFQVPGETYCQLRPFVLEEPALPGGRFKKQRQIKMGGVRFQSACR